MKHFLTKLVLLWVCALAPAALAEALRVGLSPDYAPLAFKQDGRVVGIEVDNSRAVGEFMGRKIELVELPFEQLIPSLLSGEIDVIMSGLSVTSERAAQVLFADAYMRVGQMAIMHQEKVGQFSQPWSVYRDGVRIGVEPGTTGAAFAERELGGIDRDPALRLGAEDLLLEPAQPGQHRRPQLFALHLEFFGLLLSFGQ